MLNPNYRSRAINLINLIPEAEMEMAIKFLEFLAFYKKQKTSESEELDRQPLSSIEEEEDNVGDSLETPLSSEEYFAILESLPIDDEPWTEEDERVSQEVEEEIKRGEYITIEEFDRKWGLK